MAKATAKARLTFEVEVDLSSGWRGDCTVAQLEKQARNEAKSIADKLTKRMRGESDEFKTSIKMRLIGIDDKVIVEIGNEKG